MKITKRVVAVVLCAVMLLSTCVLFSGCAEKLTKDNPGVIIPLYMTNMTSFDPAIAYADEASAKLLSLVYQGLFTISSSGKLEKALCKDYSVKNNVLTIKLKSTKWSDGMSVDADDFVYAWSRILDPEMYSEAASLLFGIKNAVEVKNGDLTVSSLGITAAKTDTIEIELEEWADVDRLLYNFASVALFPVREDVVKKIKDENWATIPAVLVSNGCFYVKSMNLGLSEGATVPTITLERNSYYYLKTDKNESLDKYVVPYRLVVHMTDGRDSLQTFIDAAFAQMRLDDPDIIRNKSNAIKASMTDEELAKYTNAQLLALAEAQIKDEIRINQALEYIDQIETRVAAGVTGYYDLYDAGSDDEVLFNDKLPLNTVKTDKNVVKKDMLVTGAFYFNTENEVLNTPAVRLALSSVLDREYIAGEIFGSARAATGLITDKVFNTSRKTSFRKEGGDLISTAAASTDTAKAAIDAAGVSGKTVTLTVSADDAQIKLAKYAEEQWEKLGLNVEIRILGYTIYPYTQMVNKLNEKTGEYELVEEALYEGLVRDNYRKAYQTGDFDIIFYDVNMLSTDAFSALSVFSPAYSGGAYDFSESADVFEPIKHVTKYSNATYDEYINAALKESDDSKRAELLHNAEKLLMEEMPVCPLFFYQNAYVISDELSGVSTDYFGMVSFKRTNYAAYVQAPETEPATTTGAAKPEETPAA